MKTLAAYGCGVALVMCALTGCASNETHEVKESAHQAYQNVEQEEPQTPGDRRAGPMNDRAGAQWDW